MAQAKVVEKKGRLSRAQHLAVLRLNAPHIVDKASNPFTDVNRIVLADDKAKVRYKNGMTLPASAERLLADASRRKYKHSRALGRHMQAAGNERPRNVAAHHIVAHGERKAEPSRKLLFGWGIAINDVDNGVFLPRYRKSVCGSRVAARHQAFGSPHRTLPS